MRQLTLGHLAGESTPRRDAESETIVTLFIKKKADRAHQEFFDWLSTPDGREAVRQAGIIPAEARSERSPKERPTPLGDERAE